MSLNNKIYFFKYRLNKIINKIVYFFLPYPLQSKKGQYAMIYPFFENKTTNPSKHLFDITLESAKIIQSIHFNELLDRNPYETQYLNTMPGDHYKILGALISTLKPKNIIEIGTFTGLSSLAMKKYLPQDGKITTFDIVETYKYTNCVLKKEDFEDGKLEQILADITNKDTFLTYKSLFENADLIFLDAAKDKVQERKFFENFATCNFINRPIIVLDDIKVWNMIKIWESISYPKFDISSFGHYSGTGLVDINYKKFNDGILNE